MTEATPNFQAFCGFKQSHDLWKCHINISFFFFFFFSENILIFQKHPNFSLFTDWHRNIYLFCHCFNLVFTAIFFLIYLKPLQCPFAALIEEAMIKELEDTLIMVFSEADKVIIKHYYEKEYTAYKIWKDNPEKHWDKTSVK